VLETVDISVPRISSRVDQRPRFLAQASARLPVLAFLMIVFRTKGMIMGFCIAPCTVRPKRIVECFYSLSCIALIDGKERKQADA
jgi:hypothetical protein